MSVQLLPLDRLQRPIKYRSRNSVQVASPNVFLGDEENIHGIWEPISYSF